MSSDSIYDVTDLADFDLAGGGAGSSKGTKRLSRQDLEDLHKSGNFTKQELLDYSDEVTRTFDDNEEGWGSKAQSLLDEWRAESGETTPAPPPAKVPIEYSPELQQAHDRSQEFLKKQMDGTFSEQIFGAKRSSVPASGNSIATGGVDDAAAQQKAAAQVFSNDFKEQIKRDVQSALSQNIAV